MSLIADALKTAQREKQQRSTGDRPVPVPLLVPLRSRPGNTHPWRIVAAVATGMLAIAVGVYGIRGRVGDVNTPLRPSASDASPPPVSAPSTAIAAARRVAPPTHPDTSVKATVPASLPGATRRSVAATVPPLRETPAPAVQQAAPVTRPQMASGRLQISVDEPRDAEVARLLAAGVAAHRSGDFDGARRAYESVLSLAPTDVDALNNLALVLLAQGDAPRAEVLLRRAISLAPRNGGAWSNLGTVLRMRGRSSDAIGAFQYALSIDPENQTARVGLAQQYLAIGSLDQARSLLQDVMSTGPDGPEAQYTLGQVLELQADTVGAMRAYREFIRVAPPRLAASVERVRVHLDTLAARAP